MALQFHTVSVGDFLKVLMKTQRSKEPKVYLRGEAYWLTDLDRLVAATDDPDCNLQITGFIESDEGVMYMTILASMAGTGDLKKLAIPYEETKA